MKKGKEGRISRDISIETSVQVTQVPSKERTFALDRNRDDVPCQPQTFVTECRERIVVQHGAANRKE